MIAHLDFSLQSQHMAEQAMQSQVTEASSLLPLMAQLHRAKLLLNYQDHRRKCLLVPVKARVKIRTPKPRTPSVDGATLRREETGTPVYLPKSQEAPMARKCFSAQTETKKCLTQASATDTFFDLLTDPFCSIPKTEASLRVLQSWHSFPHAVDGAICEY